MSSEAHVKGSQSPESKSTGAAEVRFPEPAEHRSASSSPHGAVVSGQSSPNADPASTRPLAPSLELVMPPGASQATPAEPPDSGFSLKEVGPGDAPTPERDDGSVPPIDLDTGFFDGPPQSMHPEPFFDARDPRVRKSTPSAAQRRAHLTKYVAVAVALASALCMAALVKAAASRSHDEADPGATAQAARPGLSSGATTAATLNPVETTETKPSPTPSPLDSVAVAKIPDEPPSAMAPGAVDPPSASAQAAAPEALSAPPVEPTPANSASLPTVGAPAPQPESPPPAATTALAAPPATAAPVAAAPPTRPLVAAAAPAATVSPSQLRPVAVPAALPPPVGDPVLVAGASSRDSAAKEKHRSQSALEAGRLGEAVSAGERAVQLDPADAEAWLILGASYQSKGSMKDALRCFKACVDQASRGPKGECAAMLRSH